MAKGVFLTDDSGTERPAITLNDGFVFEVPDSTAPTVIAQNPRNQSGGRFTDTPIVITFNEHVKV